MSGDLRRDREFKQGEIESKIPTADDPNSRSVATPTIALDERVIDARVKLICSVCKGKGGLTIHRFAPGMIGASQYWSNCLSCGGSGFAYFEQCDVANRIICGDSAAALEKIPDDSVACAITSPPYWNLVDYGIGGQIGSDNSYESYRAQLLAIWEQVERVLQPNGKFCLNVPLMPLKKAVSTEHFGKTHTRMILDLPGDLKADILTKTGLRYYSLYIWEKQTTEKMFGSYPYPPNLLERNYCEFILVFVKPGKPKKMAKEVKEAAKLTQKEWMDLTKQIWWIYPENVKRKDGHPAPFPEALPNRLLRMYTFPAAGDCPGDIVLDPLAGWGTTCIAAKRQGRRFIGVDLNPAFCNEAVERLEGVEVDMKILSATKPSKA